MSKWTCLRYCQTTSEINSYSKEDPYTVCNIMLLFFQLRVMTYIENGINLKLTVD